jgi:CHAT domain-containing protein
LDPSYAALESFAALTAEQVHSRLPSDAVLLAYAGDAADRLWALVVTPSEVRAKLISEVTVSWLRNYLADHLDGPRRGSLLPDPHTVKLSPPRLFPLLHQALVAPVWDTLQKARTVYIVPFGPLHYLPVGALSPELYASPPMLANGQRVVYIPSATVLLNYCHRRQPSPNQGLLTVAPQDANLRFTLGAAKNLVLWAGGLALTGPAATRDALLDQAAGYRILCFLGHAQFDRRYPMASRLQLTAGDLHASEILRHLRLQADLVILSACETGRSYVLRGDEILGLSRAMLYAGTPSLMVTLWPVHEIPTRLLVEKLIRELLPTDLSDALFDPALALATAQLWLRSLSFAEAHSLLNDWDELSSYEIDVQLTALWKITHSDQAPQSGSRLFSHPFFWSPYILIGEGQNIQPRAAPVS